MTWTHRQNSLWSEDTNKTMFKKMNVFSKTWIISPHHAQWLREYYCSFYSLSIIGFRGMEIRVIDLWGESFVLIPEPLIVIPWRSVSSSKYNTTPWSWKWHNIIKRKWKYCIGDPIIICIFSYQRVNKQNINLMFVNIINYGT